MKHLSWKILARLFVAITLTAMPLSSCAVAVADPLSPNSILFSSDSTLKIYSVDPDGSSLTALADGIDPVWSPDGSRIAYVSRQTTAPSDCPNAGDLLNGIFIMNADGSNAHPVTKDICSNALFISWSPDARKIVFTSTYNDIGPMVSVINLDGSGLTDLQPGSNPTWSPDGQKIAYVASRAYGGIFSMNADGSDPVEVAEQGDNPAWSPDGSKIAFQNWNNNMLQTINPDGSGLATVYTAPSGGGMVENAAVGWSSDSTQLAFTLYGLPGETSYGIYTVPAIGGSPVHVYGGGPDTGVLTLSWGHPAVAPAAATITSPASTSAPMRMPFDFKITSTGSPIPTISETGVLPAGLTFSDNDIGTAELTGTIAAGANGVYPITITAQNGVGDPAVQNFTLTVTTDASVPTITSTNADTEAAGTPISLTIITNGYPIPKLTKTDPLPGGVKFVDNSDGTATISGIIAKSAQGNFPFTITAKNSAGTVTQSFTLTITRAPIIKAISGTIATAGTPYALTIETRGYTVPSLSVNGDTPAGLVFVDNGDGTGTLSGTPDASSAGKHTLTVVATNQSATVSKTFTITVNGPPTDFSTTGLSFPPGVKEVYKVQANGFSAPTYSLVGTVPAGIQFNPLTGKFSGKSTTDEIGVYDFVLTATNEYGSVSTDFQIIISDAQ